MSKLRQALNHLAAKSIGSEEMDYADEEPDCHAAELGRPSAIRKPRTIDSAHTGR